MRSAAAFAIADSSASSFTTSSSAPTHRLPDHRTGHRIGRSDPAPRRPRASPAGRPAAYLRRGHFAELARRYPEAMIICAHICGGGDWEWTIKALRNAPSVFIDTSGSVTDFDTVDMAVQILGADRILFGCDMSMEPASAACARQTKRHRPGENPRRELRKNPAEMQIMNVDVNAYLGHFAFRRLRHNTRPRCSNSWTRSGSTAPSSPAPRITYRNPQPGNEDVAEETRGHAGA